MTKRNFKNVILLILPIVYAIVYRLVIFENYLKYSEMINASFTVVLLALAIYLLGFRKDKNSLARENVFRIVAIYLFLTFLLMYGIGFGVGFLSNAYSRNPITIINNIFAPIIIIIIIELFRYVVIWANKDSKKMVYLFTIVIILFEIATSTKALDSHDFETVFRLVASTTLPIIIKNGVMTYLCYHVGYKVPLMYRLIMDVYVFLVPVIPDIGEYLNSLILIALPILIYIHVGSFIDDQNKDVNFKFIDFENFDIMDIPTFIFFAILAALISGIFPLYMIGIGSASMSPKINKGDAVIIAKSNGKNLKEGQIISFNSKGRVVVHRINEVTKRNNKTVYVTKGDANNSTDASVVTPKQVKGVVKVRVPLIAWPTVWLSEIINGQ